MKPSIRLDITSSRMLAARRLANCYVSGMKPIEQIRRERLAELVKEEGGQAALARKIGKDKNQINQWLGNAGSRNLSASTARLIEAKCLKPSGWMDTDQALSAGTSQALESSHLARTQRDTMRAAAKLMERAREFIIGTYNEDALIDSALDVVDEIGPERIISGEGLHDALRAIAARLKAA